MTKTTDTDASEILTELRALREDVEGLRTELRRELSAVQWDIGHLDTKVDGVGVVVTPLVTRLQGLEARIVRLGTSNKEGN